MQFHLSHGDKRKFLNVVNASFGSKDAKRGCDYRLSIVDLTSYIVKHGLLRDYHLLFTILVEIQSLLYADESKRTCKAILRLYNLTFVHAIETRGLFKKPKKLTVRKMFGQYHHALTVHAPQQFRIVPISSTNAENEERSFNFLKTISTQTSNHHPDNVISNAFIRAQVSKIAHQNIIRLK